MTKTKFLKYLKDNDVIYDSRFMRYDDNYTPSLDFGGLSLKILERFDIILYYDLDDGIIYGGVNTDINFIKGLWNNKARKIIKKLDKLEILTNKL